MAEDQSPTPPAPDRGPGAPSGPTDAPPLADDWREATLAQLDAWVEERERLIDAIDRRITRCAEAPLCRHPRDCPQRAGNGAANT